MGGLSWWHWMIVLAAFVLLFGAKKLPDAARGVGRSLRILKSEVSAMNDDQTNEHQPRNASTEAIATPLPVSGVAASSDTPPAGPVMAVVSPMIHQSTQPQPANTIHRAAHEG